VEAPDTSRRKRPQLSLKGRALRFLSRREHSRLELRRKLAPHAESQEELDKVLDELEAARLLSNQRFAESLVYRKAERFGSAVIRHELRSHALESAIVERQLASLEQTEQARARALWERRFGEPPDSPQARARQIRFLMARGFRADVVRRVVGGRAEPDEPDAPDAPDFRDDPHDS
jgi:regulatory protein